MRLSASASLPVVAAAVLAVVGSAAVRGDAPRLDGLEPASVAPHTPLTLVLVGEGFESGAKVLIETASPGRYVPHRPASVEPQRCRVDLPLGFGTRPAERRVALENPDGARTETLVLRIGAGAAEETEAEGDGGDVAAAELEADVDAAGERGPAPEEPVIASLYPAEIPAGRPVVLEVHGANFTAESRVLIKANIHAGSSRLPEYELEPFPTRFVDSELLEVELERGFYPVPGARDVVVEDPRGVRSAPAVMTIRMEEER